jgi:glycosyltransferase involved in cell wall biosynthesis
MICGLAHARGSYVVTMDDDLQNPPDQIGRLLEKIEEGYDVVFGDFRQKMHSPMRRLGTRVVGWLNYRIFNKPADLVLTNFRIMRQEIARAVCEHRTAFPYLPGLLLVTANNFANVTVEHHPRLSGESNYTVRVIARLIWRIIFNYSAFPLRVLTSIGLVTAAISFGFGLYYLVKGLLGVTVVPGWTTTVVLLSFYNGLLLALLGAIGEYVVRLVTDISAPQAYRIREIR